jgi:hypothetical protein
MYVFPIANTRVLCSIIDQNIFQSRARVLCLHGTFFEAPCLVLFSNWSLTLINFSEEEYQNFYIMSLAIYFFRTMREREKDPKRQRVKSKLQFCQTRPDQNEGMRKKIKNIDFKISAAGETNAWTCSCKQHTCTAQSNFLVYISIMLCSHYYLLKRKSAKHLWKYNKIRGSR